MRRIAGDAFAEQIGDHLERAADNDLSRPLDA
jgi:hypothetical protein